MSDNAYEKAREDRTRETLEEFKERFGQLPERFELAAEGEINQESMPTAEHPQDIKARVEDAVAQQDPHPVWPRLSSQEAFEQAANDLAPAQNQEGEGSQQVKNDAPEHNLQAPQDSEEQDRATHLERMAQDDKMARRETGHTRDDILQMARELEAETLGQGREYSQDQGYSQ